MTRAQRATYILQAGLPRDFVEGKLGIAVNEYADPLIEAMDSLHKPTHVRPDTLLTKGAAIREMFKDVLLGLSNLMEAAQESRREIEQAVATAMHDAISERVGQETIQELDELSTHTTVDCQMIDVIEVRRMDAMQIVYRVTGNVEVDLQYGSNSDVANDIGFRTSDSYPYKATVTSNIAAPETIGPNDVELQIDTSSFYE